MRGTAAPAGRGADSGGGPPWATAGATSAGTSQASANAGDPNTAFQRRWLLQRVASGESRSTWLLEFAGDDCAQLPRHGRPRHRGSPLNRPLRERPLGSGRLQIASDPGGGPRAVDRRAGEAWGCRPRAAQASAWAGPCEAAAGAGGPPRRGAQASAATAASAASRTAPASPRAYRGPVPAPSRRRACATPRGETHGAVRSERAKPSSASWAPRTDSR